jgi:hypothetical protein
MRVLPVRAEFSILPDGAVHDWKHLVLCLQELSQVLNIPDNVADSWRAQPIRTINLEAPRQFVGHSENGVVVVSPKSASRQLDG